MPPRVPTQHNLHRPRSRSVDQTLHTYPPRTKKGRDPGRVDSNDKEQDPEPGVPDKPPSRPTELPTVVR